MIDAAVKRDLLRYHSTYSFAQLVLQRAITNTSFTRRYEGSPIVAHLTKPPGKIMSIICLMKRELSHHRPPDETAKQAHHHQV